MNYIGLNPACGNLKSSKLILWTKELNCPFVDLSVSSSNCTVGLHRTICAVITARVWPALEFCCGEYVTNFSLPRFASTYYVYTRRNFYFNLFKSNKFGFQPNFSDWFETKWDSVHMCQINRKSVIAIQINFSVCTLRWIYFRFLSN